MRCGDIIKSGLERRVATPNLGAVEARLGPICNDAPLGPIEALRGTLIIVVSFCDLVVFYYREACPMFFL